nr:hypothetical protein [uncultured organism]
MRPSIRRFAILIAVGAMSAGTAQAQPAPGRQSWGKPGISFLQYRTDAVECAWLAGSTTPVSVPQVDQVFAMDGQDIFEVLESAKRSHYRTFNNVADQLEPALETCLRGRGYRPFKLTDEQNAQLKQLKRGSTSRHRYLYGLAIDPDVLKRQGL